MHVLRPVVTLLTVCGCSRPSSWTSPIKKCLYTVYTYVLWLMIHSLVLSHILDIVFNVENQDDFSENFLLTLGIFISCCKMSALLASRDNYVILIDTLQEEPFLPKNTDEIEIRTSYEKRAEWNAIVYTISVETLIGWMIVSSFKADYKSREFTRGFWLPYNYSSAVTFTLTYVYQATGMTICSLMNVACDCLFSGLLLHTYSQFEILQHRLKHILKNGNHSAKECARLHDHIYKFATMVNEEFKTIMLIQFLVSTSLFCMDLYRLMQTEMSSKFMEIILFAFCALMQILYYCWYGNEVKLKSLEIPDMIIESNWTSLDNDTKKILLMIMKRATVPIEFSSVHFVSINLESFKTILKTSYSAFSVLQ